MKTKPDQVSGFHQDVSNAYGLFVEKMRELYPEALDKALGKVERTGDRKKRKWDQLLDEDHQRVTTAVFFSFGFGVEDDEEVPCWAGITKTDVPEKCPYGHSKHNPAIVCHKQKPAVVSMRVTMPLAEGKST